MTPAIDVVVLGRPQDVCPVACASAAERAVRSAAGAALVIAVGGAAPAPVPWALLAAPAARRLRDRLRAGDVAARAGGRLVWCRSAGPSVADLAAGASATGAAVVLAVCGPREDWCEPLLETAALVLVAGPPDDPLTALAVAGLWARGIDALAAPPMSEAAAALARLGVAGLRRQVAR